MATRESYEEQRRKSDASKGILSDTGERGEEISATSEYRASSAAESKCAQESKEGLKAKAQEQAKSMLCTQKEKAAEGLNNIVQALHQTSEQMHGQQKDDVARYADRAAEKIDEFSHYLRERNMDELLSDAEDLVRRQPAIFVGGAFALGFALARFLKSSEGPGERSSYEERRSRSSGRRYSSSDAEEAGIQAY